MSDIEQKEENNTEKFLKQGGTVPDDDGTTTTRVTKVYNGSLILKIKSLKVQGSFLDEIKQNSPDLDLDTL